MSLSNLIFWSAGIVVTWAGVYHIDDIHQEILKAQVKLIYESRTETWGSPNFFWNYQDSNQLSHEAGQGGD